jgi:hypothetical protein
MTGILTTGSPEVANGVRGTVAKDGSRPRCLPGRSARMSSRFTALRPFRRLALRAELAC